MTILKFIGKHHKLSPGELLNPNVELIVDDILENDQKDKLNNFENLKVKIRF